MTRNTNNASYPTAMQELPGGMPGGYAEPLQFWMPRQT